MQKTTSSPPTTEKQFSGAAAKKVTTRKPNPNRPLTPKYSMSRNAIFKRVVPEAQSRVEIDSDKDLLFSSGRISEKVNKTSQQEESKHGAESMATESNASYSSVAQADGTKGAKGSQSGKARRSRGVRMSHNEQGNLVPCEPQTIDKHVKVYRNHMDYFADDDIFAESGFSTRAIHAGNFKDPIHGGVMPAIDLSTTYAQTTPGEMASCFDYLRCGNPTILNFQRNLASLEKSKYSLALNTGMAAIITTLSLLKSEDHMLVIDDVYGCTQRYLRKILCPNYGVTFDLTNMEGDLSELKGAFKENTKMVWVESPTNPTLKCVDIQEIAKICKEKGAILVVDNTFMSPVLQNPISLGADLCVQSITKYICGHSDVIGGSISMNDDQLYEKLHFQTKAMGSMITPFDAYMALRSTKTLHCRVMAACSNALQMAKMMEKHPKIQRVTYPGLKSHPHHEVAKKNAARPDLQGGSGMISFYVDGDLEQVRKFLKSLQLFHCAESLGGVESLIESPAIMTHSSVPAEVRQKLGIVDNFVRMSVGIEDASDLIRDVEQALDQI